MGNDKARRRRWLGYGFFAVTPFVAVAVWFAGVRLYGRMGWPLDSFGWVTAFALIGGSVSLALGKRLTSHGGEGALLADRRPPVLFLRSFVQDRTSPFATDTPESRLAAALREIGPVIAVGRPAEGLAPEGAARFYYRDEEWRQRVEEHMGAARAVVIAVGATPNLLWEVSSAIRTVPPERVLLALPDQPTFARRLRVFGRRAPSREESYAEFRRTVAGAFPHDLPAALGDAAFVAFRADWAPYLLRPPRWKVYAMSHVVRIREALRPWCMNLGIRLGKGRMIAAGVGYSLMMSAMAIAALVVFVNMLCFSGP